MFDVVYSLYKDAPNPTDPIIRPLMILAIFAQATQVLDTHISSHFSTSERQRISDAHLAAVNKITERLDSLGISPLSKLDLMQVLESRIVRSHRPVFRYIAKHQDELGITAGDIDAITENTALAALVCPSKVFITTSSDTITDAAHPVGDDAQRVGGPTSDSKGKFKAVLSEHIF